MEIYLPLEIFVLFFDYMEIEDIVVKICILSKEYYMFTRSLLYNKNYSFYKKFKYYNYLYNQYNSIKYKDSSTIDNYIHKTENVLNTNILIDNELNVLNLNIGNSDEYNFIKFKTKVMSGTKFISDRKNLIKLYFSNDGLTREGYSLYDKIFNYCKGDIDIYSNIIKNLQDDDFYLFLGWELTHETTNETLIDDLINRSIHKFGSEPGYEICALMKLKEYIESDGGLDRNVDESSW